MESNYSRLGDFIVETGPKNSENEITLLQGISNNKHFQKAKTNTVGIKLETYRIVRTNEFAFNRATTRNGEKISIARRKGEDCVVSPSYRIFKIKDESLLNSEYLEMWFKRPAFDRYARFRSHGSAHEFFDYDEMCEVRLPVPSLEKQQEIVDDYNTVQDRIRINEQLNTALEETAQALYKHWFVDFEFPISLCHTECHAEPVEAPVDERRLDDLNNENLDHSKGYKSSGGAMVYNEELDQEIPVGWEVVELDQEFEFRNGKKKPKNSGSIPIYGGNGILGFTNKYNSTNSIIIGRVGAYCGSLFLEQKNFWTSDNAINAIHNSNCNYYAFHLLKSLNINEKSEGTGQPLITQKILSSIRFLQPTIIVVESFENLADNFLEEIERLKVTNKKLIDMSSVLLSKMATVMDGKMVMN